jgi:hypothetical protein
MKKKQERSVIFKGVKKNLKREKNRRRIKRRHIERPTSELSLTHSFRQQASFTIHFFCANHFYVLKHHECFMYCHDFFSSFFCCTRLVSSCVHYIMREASLSLGANLRREGNFPRHLQRLSVLFSYTIFHTIRELKKEGNYITALWRV